MSKRRSMSVSAGVSVRVTMPTVLGLIGLWISPIDAASNPPVPIGELPTAIASFGAAIQGDWLYVLGGHVGRRHEHSTANLSDAFVRRKLHSAEPWETLPGSFPLQSVSLVSDGVRLYRVGGMTARNQPGEAEDLQSVDDVAAFDPRSLAWTPLPPLPSPRSSHDAVVIGGKLYVAGGWRLNGSPHDAEWLSSGYALDLKQPDRWAPLPDAPFRRRAVAVAGSGNRLFVIGGIDEHGDVSRRVDILDLLRGEWSRGPDLPSSGFGASAFCTRGRLYVSGRSGVLHRLSGDESEWESLATISEPRIFHRMLSVGSDALLFLGGANRSGHLRGIEMLGLPVVSDPTP